jgi:hypothetical protein
VADDTDQSPSHSSQPVRVSWVSPILLWVGAFSLSILVGFVGVVIAGWNGLLDSGPSKPVQGVSRSSIFHLMYEPFDSAKWKSASDHNAMQLTEDRWRMCPGLIHSLPGLKRNEVYFLLGSPNSSKTGDGSSAQFLYDVGHGHLVLYFENEAVTKVELIRSSATLNSDGR